MNKLQKLLTYSNLSPQGKGLLRKMHAKLKQDGHKYPDLTDRIHQALQNDVWYESFAASDLSFQKHVPSWYVEECSSSGVAYFRLNKIAALLLSEHTTFFRAYGIDIDKGAKERMCVLAFLKRVYDDLLDEKGTKPSALFGEYSDKGPPLDPDYALLGHLRQRIRELAPRNRFPNYYGILQDNHTVQTTHVDETNYVQLTFEKARLSFLLDSYIMVGSVDEETLQGRLITSELFCCLDDFYDLEDDLVMGHLTFINQHSNPEQALRQKYEDSALFLRRTAKDPEPYLSSILNVMEGVIMARRRGFRKLSSVLY